MCLPRTVYYAHLLFCLVDEGDDCVCGICLDKLGALGNDRSDLSLLPCGHCYHYDCLQLLIAKTHNRTCPLRCLAPIPPEIPYFNLLDQLCHVLALAKAFGETARPHVTVPTRKREHAE